MDYYLMETTEVLEKLKTSQNGLNNNEAEDRLSKNGKNEFDKVKPKPYVLRFLNQLNDPMILILLFASIISAVLAVVKNESFADVIIILLVVVINAILGVYQETKAEKSIESLKKMSAPTSFVLRDGQTLEVLSENLVAGDIVLLDAGTAIPADGRIIESKSLQIEESPLTGESVAVDKLINVLTLQKGSKEISLADRKNMAYMGSTVVYGRGKMVVTATGMNTEMGKIAKELQNARENKTPLQIKMTELSKILTWLVIGICIVVFAVQLIWAGGFDFEYILNSFMIAVSLAVAAIPEGLPAVVTVALSIGVTKMSNKNAIIRKLTAVETLGSAQIICTDKTGTLTQNKMKVIDFYGDEKLLKIAMGNCNDANESNGEPTELALYNWAKIDKLERLDELPFDSNRKMMSTLHRDGDKIIQFTKGAPSKILERCSNVDKEKVLEVNKAMADKALRVLACAFREATSIEENNLTFIGLVGMIDPVRPEVKEAIKQCKSAGIQTIMITGDNIDTARAIANELDILGNNVKAISGSELNEMSDADYEKCFKDISVYARVSPEHKTRIVKAWQNAGYVVAMTGDGVNDAPSIKNADIGVGMGITGTDVTKNVADMVLADDNFATIVGAVKEGRRIYDNILKCVQYLLSSNIAEVVGIFFASLFGFVLLQPVHLLWVNLVTDCVPALALSVEDEEPGIMKRKPRSKNAGIFAGGLAFDIVYQGIVVAALILLSYLIGHYIDSGKWEFVNSSHGLSMAFLTMCLVECFHSLNMRSRRQSIFKLNKQNWLLFGSVVVSILLTTVVCEFEPITSAFKLQELGILEWLISLGLGLAIIPIVEIVKLFQRKFKCT